MGHGSTKPVDIAKHCPECGVGLTPTIAIPSTPDFWMRLRDRSWRADETPPTPLEVAAKNLAYRCRSCGKTFRLVTEAQPGSEPARDRPDLR